MNGGESVPVWSCDGPLLGSTRSCTPSTKASRVPPLIFASAYIWETISPAASCQSSCGAIVVMKPQESLTIRCQSEFMAWNIRSVSASMKSTMSGSLAGSATASASSGACTAALGAAAAAGCGSAASAGAASESSVRAQPTANASMVVAATAAMMVNNVFSIFFMIVYLLVGGAWIGAVPSPKVPGTASGYAPGHTIRLTACVTTIKRGGPSGRVVTPLVMTHHVVVAARQAVDVRMHRRATEARTQVSWPPLN